MEIIEKRIYPRVTINSLVSYVCLGEDGKPIKQSMASAIDISQGGLLLETSQEIDPGSVIMLMAADEQDRLIEISGIVTYCRDIAYGKFLSGISFQGTLYENINFAKCIIRAHYYRRKHARKK